MLAYFCTESRFSASLNRYCRFLVLLLLSLTACSSKTEPIIDSKPKTEEIQNPVRNLKMEGQIFGTRWVIKARGAGLDQKRLLPLIEADFEAINQGMSTWRQDSEISRFNSGAVGAYRFGPQSVEVIKRSLEMARHTQGAFDPTVAPLIRLWGFGAKALKEPPTPELLDATRQRVGYEKISWNNEGKLIKKQAGLSLDLSAIAKGYAVDRVAAIVRAQGAQHGMVEIGGEVVAWGSRAQGGPWKLAVDAPVDNAEPGQRFAAIVKLMNKAMATSGDYRQFRIENGRRVQHIIDPRTGVPVEHGLASVTVVAQDCITADAYATALMVMGVEAGVALINSVPRVDALFLERQPKGWRQIKTRNMGKYLIP